MREELCSAHLFSRSSKLMPLARGEGVYVWDDVGRRYIDGSSGPVCVVIGHGVREVAEAVARQMSKISFAHSSHFTTDSVIECADKLAKFSPYSLKHVFFASGGSEATETAAKMARQYHLERGENRRYKIISRWQSYHGNTLGALSMSGNIPRRRNYVPMLLDFPHIPPAYCYRCWFKKDRESCDLECAWALEKEIKSTGAEYVSAFIAEPIVGATLGTVPAPEGYFQIIREICDKYGVLFIADEVMTGFGRTGKNFAIEHWGVEPDIIATAKGISSGYIPLGAVIASEKVFTAFKNPFVHGHTYGSHPVACAVGAAVLDYIEKNHLVQRSEELGKYFLDKLQSLKDSESVGDVRGVGLFSGLEFVKDKSSKEPFDAEVRFNQKVLERCFNNGLLVYPGFGSVDGVKGDHIQVAPPLVVSKSQIDEIVQILGKSVIEAEAELK
ncbi:aspartate aminotransferase family protein [Candidatus Bathyarchaeota archaeon]|nr:aspartate aminotransferase family protein [Candidatus Bathyarchaeota archaeon]